MSYDDTYTKTNLESSTRAERQKLTLPDFDTLRFMAKNEPEKLENLRIALCNKVIDEAPDHAKPRLQGLMFQINNRRSLASSEMEACEQLSSMMQESLQHMQSMLKDLRTMQSESILLSTRRFHAYDNNAQGQAKQTADILPFRQTKH
ncbi:MAG: DUF3135 domain-containing protein [Cellvibrionales bacterium]|jgi:hypothetical protein|nr:DUF3135 domain-containing protein [Cellvibrionales bacterium]